MKAIVYASVHHGNTKKVVEAIAKECEVELIDATQVKEKDLSGYEAVGFASGIYYSKFHQSVLNNNEPGGSPARMYYAIDTCFGYQVYLYA